MNIGISKEEFIGNYFEKNFLFHRNSIPSHGIKWDHIDDILFSLDPSNGMLNIFKDGIVPIEKYTENLLDLNTRRLRIIKDAFNEYMRNGATLVINRLDTKSSLVNRLTMKIGQFIGERTVANGYAAFGGEGTFSKHWDTHDVFAVQLIGSKRWKVFEPTFPLPLAHQKSKNFKHECPQKPVFDEILNSGDVLYIPRGWWHEAIPLKNMETFHIAVGVHTLHMVDYILWSCINKFTEIPTLRKTFKHENYSTDEIDNSIHSIKNILTNKNNIDEFKIHQATKERVNSKFNIKSIFESDLPKQYLSKSVKINSTLHSISHRKLYANGMKISYDEISEEIFQLISDKNGSTVEEIISKISPDLKNRALSLIKILIEKDAIYLE